MGRLSQWLRDRRRRKLANVAPTLAQLEDLEELLKEWRKQSMNTSERRAYQRVLDEVQSLLTAPVQQAAIAIKPPDGVLVVTPREKEPR